MEVVKISPEAFQKALETIGLVKAETVADDAAKAEELKKAEEATEKAKLETELADTLKKAEELKNKIEGKVAVVETPAPATTPAATPAVEAFNKAEIVGEISKAISDKITALGTMIMSKDETIEKLQKSIDQVNEFSVKLAERLKMIEGQPATPKGLTGVKYIERFEKGGEQTASDVKTLSLSNLPERAIIVDTLFSSLSENTQRGGAPVSPEEFEIKKAVHNIEQLGKLSDNAMSAGKIAARLKERNKIVVVQ